MISILHIITDYPDGINERCTQAVKNLLDATSNSLNHKVISVIRKRKLIYKLLEQNDVISIQIPSLPGGLFNSFFMFTAYLYLRYKLGKIFFNFDFVHGHKLAIDSVLAWIICKAHRTNLLVSVRGTTDQKWVKWKVHTRFLYRIILKESKHIFWVSSWAKKSILSHLNYNIKLDENKKFSLLPNLCHVELDQKEIVFSNKFVFVGRYDRHDSKGLLKLITALKVTPDCSLDIYGSYSPKDISQIMVHAKSYGVEARLDIKGRVDNSAFRQRLSQYGALLMPSNPETFGMVYVEALSSNIPFLGSKNSGVTGYFDNKSYACFVDEKNQHEINEALKYLLKDQLEIKTMLQNDIKNKKLDFLKNSNISQHYTNTLKGLFKC